MFLLPLLTNKDSYNTQIIQCVNDTIFRKRFRVPGCGTGSYVKSLVAGAPESQKHQEWCYDKFSAAVRTCSVTGYTVMQNRLFHTVGP